MKIEVHYFGMLAEVTTVTKETIDSEGTTVCDIVEYLTQRYPTLKERQFRVAVDQKLASDTTIITQESEIALLPPFAGG